MRKSKPRERDYHGPSRMDTARRSSNSMWDDRLDTLIARIDRVLNG